MNSLEKGVITLIKSALTGNEYSLPMDFDAQKAIEIAKAHQIYTLVCFGAKNCKLADELAMDKLLVDAYKFTVLSEAQTELIEKITALFEKENQTFLLAKTIVSMPFQRRFTECVIVDTLLPPPTDL